MSKIEVTTPITRRSLSNKAKDQLVDLIMMMTDWLDYREKRIAMLEKALEILGYSAKIVTLKQGDIYNDSHRYRPGDEVIIVGGYYPGEVLGLAAEYPELAQYLRGRADPCILDGVSRNHIGQEHIPDAKKMVGEGR